MKKSKIIFVGYDCLLKACHNLLLTGDITPEQYAACLARYDKLPNRDRLNTIYF